MDFVIYVVVVYKYGLGKMFIKLFFLLVYQIYCKIVYLELKVWKIQNGYVIFVIEI